MIGSTAPAVDITTALGVVNSAREAGEIGRITSDLKQSGARSSQEMVQAAQKFEAVLMGQIAQMMLETVPVSESFGGGHAESMYRGMLAEEMGNEMARKGGLKLSPVVLDQMISMQDAMAAAAGR